MHFKNLGEIFNANKTIVGILSNNSLDEQGKKIQLATSLKQYSVATIEAAAAQTGLTKAQAKAILIEKELKGKNLETTAAQLEKTAATTGTTVSQTSATASTFSLKTAYEGLAVSLGISTTALTVWIAALSSVVVGALALKTYHDSLERLASETKASAQETKAASAEIESYTEQYGKLREELLDATTTEERQAEIKKELLAIQTDLNEKYGDEYGKINLVTDAYKDQTEALKNLNKELASDWLRENNKGVNQAISEMEKVREYTTSIPLYDGMELTNDIKSIVDGYSDKGVSFIENSSGEGYVINIKANAEDAKQVIKELSTEIYGLTDRYEDNNILSAVIDNLNHSDSLVQDTLDKYQETYNQAQIYTIAKSSTMSADYQDAINAVQQYNDAVASGDYSSIKEARTHLDEVRNSINLTETKWQHCGSVIEDVFNQADTRIWDFRDTLSDTDIEEWTNKLQGLDVTILRGMENDGQNGDVFDPLIVNAQKAGLTIDELISLLQLLGIVAVETNNYSLEPEKILNKTEMISALNELSSGFEALDKVMESQKDTSAFDYSLLADKDFVETFGGLGEVYSDFVETISDSPKDIKSCQSAYDNLVTEWIHSKGILADVTEENANLTEAMLKNMGISNASEVVTAALVKQKAEVAWKSRDVEANTLSEIEAILKENEVVDDAKDAWYAYFAQKLLDETYNGAGDIEALASVIEALDLGTQAWHKYYTAKKDLESIAESGTKRVTSRGNVYYDFVGEDGIKYSISEQAYNDKKKDIDDNYDDIIKSIKDLTKIETGYSGGVKAQNPSGSSSSTKDPKQEEIDWIARRNEFLQKQHDITKKIAEDETATYNERKEALQDLITQDEKRAEVAKTSAEHYKQAWLKASENLTTDDKLKITHDTESIDVETYDAQELLNSGIVDSLEAGEKYIENLKKAIEYWDLMKDSEEDEKQIREENLVHQKEALELLKEEAEHQLDLNTTLADQVESRKELMEAQGQYINAGTYKELISLSKEEESILQDKLDTLQQQLNLEDEQTSAWYSIKAEIESAENALIQCQSTQADLNNTLKRLPIERLEIMRNFYSHIIEDMDHIIDLQSSMGLKPTKEQLQDYIGLYDEQIAKTLEEQEKLKDLLDDYEYGSDLYNKTADEIQNLDNELASMVKTQREYNNTLLEMPLNDVTEEVNSLTSARTALEEAISIKESEGLSKTLDDYQALQKVTEAEIGSLQKKRSVLSTLLETYAETYGTESDMYKDTLEQLNDVNSDINSLIQSQKQWNEELLQIPIDNIEKASDSISGYKDEVQGVIDLNNAKGRETTLEDYQKLAQANQVTLNTLTKEKAAYEEVLKSLDKNSSKYKEIEDRISGIDDEIADCVKQQHEWNTEILQIPIKNLEAIGDSLSDYSSGIESILGDYDSAISAVTKTIDDQKEAIQEERDATEKLYDERIEKLNEEKDLLTQTNNDRKLQLDLEQKLYERDRARNQKTVAVMNADGKLEYRSDMDALRDAEQGVADAQYNIKVNELEKEIKLLEESKAAELEKYDIKLDNLEKIKGKWSEIVEKIEAAVNAEKATELLGEGWQDKVLSGNDDDIRNKLQDDYSKYHNENVEVNELSESNDRLIQALGRIITAYQNGEMTYDQAQSELGKLTETAADGYSALEALSDKMRLDGIYDFNQISSSLKEQLSTTSKQVSDNLKVVNDNAESVENHETTWEDLPGKLDKYVNSFNTSIKSLDKFVDTYNKNAAAIDQNVTSWENIQKYIDGQITSATYDVKTVKEYIDAFKANAKSIDENVSDWDEMKGLIDEQVKALKQAAEALEESKHKDTVTVKYERDDSEESTTSEKATGVYSGQYGYLYKYDHENGTLVHPETGEDLGVKNYKEFMAEYEDDLKKGTYHKGIFKGAVKSSGSQLDEDLKALAQPTLKNDEAIIKAQVGEYVYQPEQILNTITNAQKMVLPAMEPLLEHLLTQQTITGLNAFNQIDRIKDMVNTGSQSNLPLTNIGNTDKHVEVNFNGGITMHEVQDVEQFTYKLISTADSMISQKMSKIF